MTLSARSRLFAWWSSSPSKTHRDAVAPLTAPACGPASGDARSLEAFRRFEFAVMPEVSGRGVPDLVHGGSDDLLLWPPSAPERALALEWCATGRLDIRDDLYALAGSEDRGGAIAELVYTEQRAAGADLVLDRAFGPAPSVTRGAR